MYAAGLFSSMIPSTDRKCDIAFFIIMNKIITLFWILPLSHLLWSNAAAADFIQLFEAAQERAEQKIPVNISSTQSSLETSTENSTQENINLVIPTTENSLPELKLKESNVSHEEATEATEEAGEAGEAERRGFSVRTDALAWLDAELACWRSGGRLAAPRNRHEALELGRMLVANAADVSDTEMRDAMHAGVHDIARQGAWHTLDGRLLSEAGYDLWLEGGVGSCGALGADGRYMRTDCSAELAYACETEDKGSAWKASGYSEVDGAGLFRLYEEPLPWALALRRCEAEGATLAVPESAREAGLLAGVLVTRAAEHERLRQHGFFVGITDVAREGDWRTVTGQRLQDTGYDTWGPQQPSGRRSQNCGKLTADGRYADAACMAPLAYCCKLNTAKGETSGGLAWRGGAGGARGGADALVAGPFRLHTTALPWFDALRACQRTNATLAVPSTAQEGEVLALLASAREANALVETRVHVGIHDIAESGTWKTLWGEVVLGDDPGLNFYAYGKFNRKRIKLYGTVSDSCAYMNNAGEFGNIHCSIRLPFVCQKAL